MVTSRGEWPEQIGWYLATRGPSTYSGIMKALGLELGWRNGARKALRIMTRTNRLDHTDEIYKLLDVGALDLANSLIQSSRFENLSVLVSSATPPGYAEGLPGGLTRSNFQHSKQVSFSAPASIGNVLSIAASAVKALSESTSCVRSSSRPSRD